MKRLVYLGTLIALFVVGLSLGSLAGAQEAGDPIPEPVPGGTTPVQQEVGDPIPEPVPGGTTPVDGGEDIGGRITDPVEETPVDQYGTIPNPQPSTPVEGPPSGESDISVLPDTGGLSGLPWIAGALLLGGGLVVRRIIR